MSLFQKSYTVREATKKLEHYCAYQERCHMEVVAKLREMHMIPEATDQIVTHLIQENLLNEERFSRAFARGKFTIKFWGKKRIITELQQRNITKSNINNALSEIDDEAYEKTLDLLARKRLGQIREKNSLKKRKKLAEYLLYRGWEPHLVYDKIAKLIK